MLPEGLLRVLEDDILRRPGCVASRKERDGGLEVICSVFSCESVCVGVSGTSWWRVSKEATVLASLRDMRPSVEGRSSESI